MDGLGKQLPTGQYSGQAQTTRRVAEEQTPILYLVPKLREKKPERKRKNLIRMGIAQGQAYAWSRTRMGGWAVTQSPILVTTITLSRLRRKGYLSMLDYYSKSKPEIQ
jgi:hypothetical protein